ncbi:MAG: Kelch repeat-containing protein [Candidatus Binataceae bacterium]
MILGGIGNTENAIIGSSEVYSVGAARFLTSGSLECPQIGSTTASLEDGRVFVAGGSDGYSSGALDTVELYDPMTGTFTPTVSLPDHRIGFTATTLNDGTVPIAGGEVFPGCVNSINSKCTGSCTIPPEPILTNDAEIFDPSTETFAEVGSLNVARSQHLAALLLDGRVLIVGGTGPEDSAEIYDPGTQSFTLTGNIPGATSWDHAVTLTSGKVLLIGGLDTTTDSPVENAELFDPVSNAFTPTSNLVTPRTGEIAALLNNGNVLVAGGMTCSPLSPLPPFQTCNYLSAAEIYDPGTGLFTSTGSMSLNRLGATGVNLGSGNVLVAGGTTCVTVPQCSGSGSAFQTTGTAELYDPANGTFALTGSMIDARIGNSAAELR